MNSLSNYLMVFLGAGLGGALRHAVNVIVPRVLSPHYPYSTLIVNVGGSFVMGLIAGWFAYKGGGTINQAWRLFLTTGVLGGFTTFSAFSLEVALLWERGESWYAGLYIVASVTLAICGIFGGLGAVRLLE